ncbi:MAG: flagellar hook protein [Xanthobacteraceae bacterium]|nr:flagellar hook protein [Xanthobacteraceae bacterium]
MSGIVLSASVRQNLLSLQSTADLLSVTQNRLATGNKVNSALDNPTNFFTAQGLTNRASDINNLLDSIGNGVQVLQAANTGITSLQKLVDTAKSIANQALQATSGYSSKSKLTTASLGATATADNLLGTGADTPATAGTVTAGTFAAVDVSGAGSAATAATAVTGSGFSAVDVSSGSVAFTLSVDGTSQAITIDAAAVTAYNTAQSASLVNSALSAQDVADIINYQFDNTGTVTPVSVVGGELQIDSGTTGATSNITITGYTDSANGGAVGLANANNSGSAAVAADSLAFSVTVDGTAHNITLSDAVVSAYNTANSTSLDSSALSAADVAALINDQVGSAVTTVSSGGALVFTSGTTGSTSSIATSAVTAAGSATNTTGIAVASNTGADLIPGSLLSGQTLDIASTAGGTAVSLTFGTGTGQISTLDQLNTALAVNNITASLSTDGKLTFTTTNDYASSTLGAFTGTATGATGAFGVVAVAGPVADANAQNTRANLISQYNQVIDQIKTTAQDASFNGVNLLNGDQLKLVFNETGKSTLTIQGVTFDPAGLGLATLTKGTDFLDNAGTNKVLGSLNDASSALRSQASSFGSNLSIVQIRQDFNKNLINVLQTGSSNLTLADTNEEAANSQALATRQSIAVSALALANQSQQSVLQLLR